MWNNLQDLPSEKKQDAIERATNFAHTVWEGKSTPTRVYIWLSLEGSSSAQATLGSTVSTPVL